MKLLSKSNSKLYKDGILTFGLPAGKTCPGAGACKAICYAQKGCYRFKNVKAVQEARLEVTKQDDFARLISLEIFKHKKAPKAIRIHDSGDFYSQEYLNKWVLIAHKNPDIIFYAYTKSLDLDFSKRPANLLIIASYGSLFDDSILALMLAGKVDSAAMVVDSVDSIAAGSVDSSSSDLVAIDAAQNGLMISLIKH
jgi:hypothetical protein